MQHRDGDWFCVVCGHVVFASKDRCRCGATYDDTPHPNQWTPPGCEVANLLGCSQHKHPRVPSRKLYDPFRLEPQEQFYTFIAHNVEP